MALVTEATIDTFEEEVEKSVLPVLVDFWAPWCQPCRLLIPALDQISSAYAGRVKVVRVNTDANQELAVRFGIRGLPTVVLFVGGEIRDHAIGVRPKEEYIRYLERALRSHSQPAEEASSAASGA